MDPALLLAASVAGTSLALWTILSIPLAARRLGSVRIPTGPVAGLLAGSLLLVASLRDRPAHAETPPPIIRLGGISWGPAPDAESRPVGDLGAGDSSGSVRIADTRLTGEQEYVVVAGDSLWEIARRHLAAAVGSSPNSAEVDRFWREIYAANRELVGDDPNVIFPGQRLRLRKV